MSLDSLRKKLHEMACIGSSVCADESMFRERLDEISRAFPNSVKVLPSELPIASYRCLEFALGLHVNKDYKIIELNSEDSTGTKVVAEREFVDWMQQNQHLSGTGMPKPQQGDLTLYFDSTGWQHAGIVYSERRIISKWGIGLLYNHALLEIPENYGSELRYYKQVDQDTAYSLFVEYAKEKGIEFDS